MYVVIVDILALILFVAGIALLLRSSKAAGGGAGAKAADPDAGTYGRRIGGTMMMAFGLAIGLMVTLFHFASAG
jgi:hypothetical protein